MSLNWLRLKLRRRLLLGFDFAFEQQIGYVGYFGGGRGLEAVKAVDVFEQAVLEDGRVDYGQREQAAQAVGDRVGLRVDLLVLFDKAS